MYHHRSENSFSFSSSNKQYQLLSFMITMIVFITKGLVTNSRGLMMCTRCASCFLKMVYDKTGLVKLSSLKTTDCSVSSMHQVYPRSWWGTGFTWHISARWLPSMPRPLQSDLASRFSKSALSVTSTLQSPSPNWLGLCSWGTVWNDFGDPIKVPAKKMCRSRNK